MTDLPEPLTPPDCDLRDFSRMMIDITRLFGSTFNAKASRNPVAWMIGHKLWYKSWHQMPAASLPDDDEELCYLAELGFDMKTFKRAKEMAMHGWVKCSDGRLYHPVVAEAALDAWASRQRRRYNTECGRIKKHNQRHGTKIEAPSFEDFIASGCAATPLASPPPNGGTAGASPEGQANLSPGTSEDVPRENSSKGEGKGEGYYIKEPNGSSPPMIDHVGEAFAAYDALRREIVTGARMIHLTPDRRKKLAARVSEIGGPDEWAQVLSRIRASAFLRGETSRNGSMVATIDWLLEPKNLRKVMEGNYDDRSGPTAGPSRPRPSAVDSIREARALIGLG